MEPLAIAFTRAACQPLLIGQVQMQSHFDVIIVGAGPAGSTAALLLARAGWSVVIVEKHVFPRRKVCGECIAASNWDLFDWLGIHHELAQRAGPELRRTALMVGNRTITAELPAQKESLRPWGRALSRESLDSLLLEQVKAAGVAVFQPWTVMSLQGSAGDFHCTLRSVALQHELEVRAPIAIVAHGSWERFPRLPRLRRPSDLFAFKANFRGASLPAGMLPVLSFKGGYGGMVMVERDLVTVACCIRTDCLSDLRRAGAGRSAGDAVSEMLQRECAGVAAALRGARRVDRWLACGPLDPGLHFKRDDEIFRIGNAAAEAHPIIGEGMSMAIQSAWLLCAQLLKDAPGHLLGRTWQERARAAYTAQWRHQFMNRLRLAELFAQVAMRPRLLTSLLPLINQANLLTRGARWSGKVRSAVPPAIASWLVAAKVQGGVWKGSPTIDKGSLCKPR